MIDRFQAWLDSEPEIRRRSQEKGWRFFLEKAFEAGRESGYTDGYDEGKDTGYNEGNNEGYDAGYDAGRIDAEAL